MSVITKMTNDQIVEELKEICISYDLPISGNKTTLIERIQKYKSTKI